jgi:hypothetical protein
LRRIEFLQVDEVHEMSEPISPRVAMRRFLNSLPVRGTGRVQPFERRGLDAAADDAADAGSSEAAVRLAAPQVADALVLDAASASRPATAARQVALGRAN